MADPGPDPAPIPESVESIAAAVLQPDPVAVTDPPSSEPLPPPAAAPEPPCSPEPEPTATPVAQSAASPYTVPKFVLTPIEASGDDAPDTTPKPGHRHATSQTLITSAPGLRTRPDSETTVVDDPSVAESVTVIRRYQRVLRRVFDHYATDGVLDRGAFLTLCKEFALVPALIEPDDLVAVCRAVPAPALAFRDLIAVLTRLALTVYRQHARLNSAEQKLSSLFRAMQLDQKDIVLHRLRKTPPTTTAALTTTTSLSLAAELEFDQKDLDREVDRILDSMKAPIPDKEGANTAADLIGPLAAQVQVTMDRVRQYTSGTGSSGRRPARRSLDSTATTAFGWRPAHTEADPFLRPIIPPGPITTLPPLYYPGLSSSNRHPVAAASVTTAITAPDSDTYRSEDIGAIDTAPVAAVAAAGSSPPSSGPRTDKRRRPGPRLNPPNPTPVTTINSALGTGPKAKGRVGEATREKAAQVAAAEKTTERRMQQRHMGQLDRRRGHQMQRLGRHVPTQFAGKYAAVS